MRAPDPGGVVAEREAERRRQNELRALAAERRLAAFAAEAPAPPSPTPTAVATEDLAPPLGLIFGESGIARSVVEQWASQGLTLCSAAGLGHLLVQRHGGPCGVLAPLQAFLLKHLVFSAAFQKRDAESEGAQGVAGAEDGRPDLSEDVHARLGAADDAAVRRALQCALCETLWRAGGYGRAVLVTGPPPSALDGAPPPVRAALLSLDEAGACVDGAYTAAALASALADAGVRARPLPSRAALFDALESALASGALAAEGGCLFALLSLVLSRGVDGVASDRDDPTAGPLITPPFGHAGQEVVNLMLCGRAVSHVFDGEVALGDGLALRGVPSRTQVGFLTLLEHLNYTQVGEHMKRPEYPIWVVGSESHYTVLFAASREAQREDAGETRLRDVRAAFDAEDASGGGGFVTAEGIARVGKAVGAPAPAMAALQGKDIVTWQEFWAALTKEENRGEGEGGGGGRGAKGLRTLSLWHVNGIAKPRQTLGGQGEGKGEGKGEGLATPTVTALRVALMPSLLEAAQAAMGEAEGKGEGEGEGKGEGEGERVQWCPLVDAIRTRWKNAECRWQGDAPSMV